MFRPSQEYIPASTVKAVKRQRDKGNLCFCVREEVKLDFDHIMDVGFDGIIGAGGGFVEIGDPRCYITNKFLTAINHVVDYFEANEFDYYIA